MQNPTNQMLSAPHIVRRVLSIGSSLQSGDCYMAVDCLHYTSQNYTNYPIPLITLQRIGVSIKEIKTYFLRKRTF